MTAEPAERQEQTSPSGIRPQLVKLAGRVPRMELLPSVVMYLAQGVVSLAVAVRVLGFLHRPFSIPLVYWGDALSGGSQFKGVLENGWYENNPMLGAPHGQTMHDFPMADNLQFVFARILGLFIDQWGAVFNLTYLLTFPLAGIAATWFMRSVGCRRVVAFFFGLLYAFTPYHFFRGEPHLALSFIFVVPLFATLILKVLSGRPVWSRRPSRSRVNPLAWLTWTNAGTLAIVALLGTTSSYYSVFGLILMAVAVVVLAFRREFARVAQSIATMAALMVVMLANMAPDILYTRAVGASPEAFARPPQDSEVYSFKLTSLLLPVPWHRITALADYRAWYDSTFPLPSEFPALGIVASIGFLFLFVVPFAGTVVRAHEQHEHAPFGSVQQHLALLGLVSFLFGTVGGFGALFALWISSDIRGWNRISVYVALFGLASVGLLTQSALQRWERRSGGRPSKRWRPIGQRAVTLAVCGAIAALGILDGTPPTRFSADPGVIKAWYSDADYVAAIEKRMPAGAEIYELPMMPFPESGSIESMRVYDPLRPYLHSKDLKWSYGAVKGRPTSDWEHVLAGLSVPRMLTILAAAGFTGVHVDRDGYPHRRPGALTDQLTELLGEPIVSRDRSFQFFDMRSFVAEVHHLYPVEELDAIRRHAVQGPNFYGRGFQPLALPDAEGRYQLIGENAAPYLIVDNPGERLEVHLSFDLRLRGVRRPTSARITWPDGAEQTVTLQAARTTIERTVSVPPGQSRLTIHGEPGVTNVDLLAFQMTDPLLTNFPLHGSAGALQAKLTRTETPSTTVAKGRRTPSERKQAKGA